MHLAVALRVGADQMVTYDAELAAAADAAGVVTSSRVKAAPTSAGDTALSRAPRGHVVMHPDVRLDVDGVIVFDRYVYRCEGSGNINPG